MATTTGLVQKLNLFGGSSLACVFIGSSPVSTEVFFIRSRPSDSVVALDYKKSMIHLLAKAQTSGYEVTLFHPMDGAEVTRISLGEFNICPIGRAVHNDFYSISGTGIPKEAEIVFESDSIEVTVTPDLVRPHLVFVAELPSAIPLGRNIVRLQASGWSSDAVPIDVFTGTHDTVRVLYSGAPKSQPYTIAFVANPAIESKEGGSFSTDPVLTNRPGFHDAINYCLLNLLTVTEDLLRQDDIDAYIRFITIFDSTQNVSDDNSLAREHISISNMMEPRRNKLNDFLARYSEVADMVFVLHGSTSHRRASAWATNDKTGPSTSYTYDGTDRVHGHFPRIPGSAAIPISVNQTGLTALHEFCHGASDFNNGRIKDLYVDWAPTNSFIINKKIRVINTIPVPYFFSSYHGTNYLSDQNRDSIGYNSTWISYHPPLIDPSRPNIMDNYWYVGIGDDPLHCRLDQLTYDWFSDRLKAKIFR